MNLPLQIQKKEKLLGIIFDEKLKLQYHIENLCKKASLKLSALSRVAPFVDLPQKKFYSMPLFTHGLATVFCFGCVIAEDAIT